MTPTGTPRMRIACLHTAESNIAVFAAACPGVGVRLDHVVRADLLAAAEGSGHVTREIADQAADALLRLAETADAVVLTCSTLGPVVDEIAASTPVPVLRVDSALAEAATRAGRRVVALCAVATTVEPTRSLFAAAAAANGAQVEIRLVPGAWDEFKAGRLARDQALIAAAADAAYRGGADVVALAQASMAGAADLCRAGLPLASPAVGLAAALRAAGEPTPRHTRMSLGETP
jgi:Asp/Glu/hydantoin racemase